MIHAIIMGMAYGFGLAFLPGPAFFKLLLTGLQKGFRPSMQMALGILVSDLIYLLLVYFGVSAIINTTEVRYGLGLGGGIILMIFGTIAFFKSSLAPRDIESNADDHNNLKAFIKNFSTGFSINALNPSALFFWIATVAAAHQDSVMVAGWDHFGFFAAILISVFSTDLVKAYLSKSISSWLTTKVLVTLNRVIGLSLMIFGLKLILETTGIFKI